MLDTKLSGRASSVLQVLVWESETIWGMRHPGAYLMVDEIIALLGRAKAKEYSDRLKSGSAPTGSSDQPLERKHIAELAKAFFPATQARGSFHKKWGEIPISERAEKIHSALEVERLYGLQKPEFSLSLYVEEAISAVRESSIAAYERYLREARFPVWIAEGVSLTKAQAVQALAKFKSSGR